MVGDEIPNLIAGKAAATCSGANWGGSNIEVARGVDFSVTGVGSEEILLPSEFDLLTIGAEPSFVLSTWLTNKMETVSNSYAIMGCAYQTSAYHQWSICHRNAANTLAVQINASRHDFTVNNNIPTLITAHVKRTASGTFTMETYCNAISVGRTHGLSYPFTNAAASASASRKIGHIGGFSASWIGTVHRLQLLKVDAAFDIIGWIAKEIAANASRWAA